jgi:LysR family transcriptional regulator, nitrogen assimilation regulatory protein
VAARPRRLIRLIAILALALPAPASASDHRLRAVARGLQREHPCPSTGLTSGRCPGYWRDHIRPARLRRTRRRLEHAVAGDRSQSSQKQDRTPALSGITIDGACRERVKSRHMELRSLHYFVRIAELGSITRAAAHLHIAQPALTRHVQRLEDELEVTLFTRANRGVRLTEGGQKLLESAQRILRDLERAGDEIRAHKAHPSGKVVLAVTPTLCPVVVPELFARMRRHYPMIELKVVHAGMVRLEEFLVDGRVDMALLSEMSKSRLIRSTRLAEEEMVLVTRPRARPPGVVSPAELSRTPLILGDGLRAAMETLLAGRGIELQVEIELNDHETIRLMVQQGVGASILPHSSVHRECARRLAEAHRITEEGVFRTLALGVAVNRGASSAREAVAEIVAQVLSNIETEGWFRPDFGHREVVRPARATA